MSHAVDTHHALREARRIAAEAGVLLLEAGRREPDVAVEFKGEVDLVTAHDRRSEALIVEALGRAFPGHRVVAEEGHGAHGDDPDRPTWYVDPIDGTTNYAHRLPVWAVSLGLEVAGEALVGVVAAPELGWEFYARRGGGAYRGRRRIRVSAVPDLDGALVATGFPYNRRFGGRNNVPQLAEVIRHCQGVRRMGSAALDCAMVAWGRLDAYWEFRINPWDVCAGALLVTEAGGQVTDIDGRSFRSTGARILATNGSAVHHQMLSLLARHTFPV